jgi:DNA-3-methyladenine glycosylase I
MRCSWAEGEEMRTYHDEEWGVPLHDDAKLFELLTLEGAQAGLSWLTILKRRPGYVKAFKKFNPKAVAAFNDADVERLLENFATAARSNQPLTMPVPFSIFKRTARAWMNFCGPSSTTNRCNVIGLVTPVFRPRLLGPRL